MPNNINDTLFSIVLYVYWMPGLGTIQQPTESESVDLPIDLPGSVSFIIREHSTVPVGLQSRCIF